MSEPTQRPGRRLYAQMSPEELQQMHAHRGRPRALSTATAEKRAAAFRRHEQRILQRNAQREQKQLEATQRAEDAARNPKWYGPR